MVPLNDASLGQIQTALRNRRYTKSHFVEQSEDGWTECWVVSSLIQHWLKQSSKTLFVIPSIRQPIQAVFPSLSPTHHRAIHGIFNFGIFNFGLFNFFVGTSAPRGEYRNQISPTSGMPPTSNSTPFLESKIKNQNQNIFLKKPQNLY